MFVSLNLCSLHVLVLFDIMYTSGIVLAFVIDFGNIFMLNDKRKTKAEKRFN